MSYLSSVYVNIKFVIDAPNFPTLHLVHNTHCYITGCVWLHDVVLITKYHPPFPLSLNPSYAGQEPKVCWVPRPMAKEKCYCPPRAPEER